MKSRLLRFLFTHTSFENGYLHLAASGEVWFRTPFLELEVFLSRQIFGLDIVHLKASGKQAVYFLGPTSHLQADLRAYSANVVKQTKLSVLSLIPDAYPTHAVLDGAWNKCNEQLEKEIKICRSRPLKDFIGADPEFIALRDLLDALEIRGHSRTRYVDAFVEKELTEYSSFFDRIEKTPLTLEQRLACVICDDRQLLVAAAGSGKSSVIVAKVGYLLAKGWVRPEQVLMLAFNKKAKEELYERCQQRFGEFEGHDRIRSQTFHGFGLDLIGKLRGRKPRISDVATDDVLRRRLIHSFLMNAVSAETRHWLAWRLLQILQQGIVETLTQAMEEEKREPLRTLKGDLVKSREELRIANFLFATGIPYEYERSYEYDVADSDHGQYKCDFYYPTIGVYHEHFALDSRGAAPKDFPEYLEKTEWRRGIHRKKKTKFFETRSADFQDHTIYDKILYWLKENGFKFEKNSREVALGDIRNDDPVVILLDGYIRNRKMSQLSDEEIHQRASIGSSWLLDVLPLSEELYRRYEEYLGAREEVDFEDMVIDAGNMIEQQKYDTGYRFLLVDEFQDMSSSRVALLQSVLKHSPASKLFGVGDDWQSINGFAGSDVRIMSIFHDVFGEGTTQFLTQTFRSNQGIANIASRFVMKNPEQLRKTVSAQDVRVEKVLEIHYLDHERDFAFVLRHLKATTATTENIYVLARYHSYLGEKNSSEHENAFSSLVQSFIGERDNHHNVAKLTIHGSKGLEADTVILLGLVSEEVNRRCFPSRMTEDELIQLPLPQREDFPDAEERRLLYVALTRARNHVVIPIPMKGYSPFVSELFECREEVQAYHQGKPMESCNVCTKGFLMQTSGIVKCTNEECAVNTISKGVKCPDCGEGQLVPKSGRYGLFVSCNRYPACSYIDKMRSQKLKNLQ
ncbi:MAG: UvrD-helicase domain-containing protein [Syntrophobacterales bacterium]|nr:UvrD-helicase domain-containing protein [Syntrophobacterales bacterium]